MSNVIGQSLDQIEKDRSRQQQIMRAQAILSIAMRERQRREMLESGQREKEVMNRSRRDYNRQMIQDAHREFVDMVINSVSKKSAELDAQKQATDLALRQVEALVEYDYQRSKEQASKNYQDELQVYLNEFLLPEVDRQHQIQKVNNAQHKWLTAGLLGEEAALVASKRVQNASSVNGLVQIDQQGVLLVEGKKEEGVFKGVDGECAKEIQTDEKK